MKTIRIQLVMLTALFAVVAPALAENAVSNDFLTGLCAHLEKMTRVTEKPVEMTPNAALLCNPSPGTLDHSLFLLGGKPVVHVYVTTNGTAAMKKSAAIFPTGTVILKQKFQFATNTIPVLYTGMLKREKGYNSDCGDWEFFTLSGDGKRVDSRGRSENCMDCHKRYAKSDFVTKRYP